MGSHSDTLMQTAGELERSQREIDAALVQRHDALEGLLGEIENRRSDFESVLQAFSGLIHDAFRDAEARAREIGTFLAESAQQTTHDVENRFAEIRAVTGKERERTAAALRAAYEQANQEMAELLGRATQGFQSAAEEIAASRRKSAASSMRRAKRCAAARSTCRARRPSRLARCAASLPSRSRR